MLSHLLTRRPLRLALLALSTALPLAACWLVEPSFAVLVPLAAMRLVHEGSGRLFWGIAPALLLPLFIRQGDLAPYLLAAGCGIVIYILLARYSSRLAAVESENERLLAFNETLRHDAARTAEYEEQLRHLSQLEERARLAQDIHDRVGHAIAGGIIQLEAASTVLERDRESARAMMRNTVNALREGMESIRSALRGIKPATEQLGIRRIKTMLDGFAASNPISARLTHSGDLAAITQPQWKVILDNVRECLTNTMLHSGARSMRVGIEVLNRIVKVEARDDGRGAYEVRKGLGLVGMEERTGGLGGKVIFDGSKGFSVIMLLPIATAGSTAEGGANAHSSTDRR
jgi:signal transduction histidine kinase